MSQTVIVTGGAGFIGSHLCDRLINEGYRTIIIDNLTNGKEEYINHDAEFYKTNICDDVVESIFIKNKPNVIFHLAAHNSVVKSIENPSFDSIQNIYGSVKLLELAKKTNVKKFIFASTAGIYGNAKTLPTPEIENIAPINPYSISKYSVENYLRYFNQQSNLSCCSLRYANVYGPRQNTNEESGVITILSNKLIENEIPILYGFGKSTRDYVYVKDIVEANIKTMFSSFKGELNIGTSKEISVEYIFNKLLEISQKDIKPTLKRLRKGEIERSCLNSSKANELISWKAEKKFDEGLIETFNWLQNNH